MIKSFLQLFFTSLLLTVHLFSDESLSKSASSSDDAGEALTLDVLMGEPSSFVNGCVDAISGAFHEVSTDVSVVGPETLAFQRIYVSSCSSKGALSRSWNINHFGQKGVGPFGLTVWDRGGAEGKYYLSESGKKGNPDTYRIDHASICKGVTNNTSTLSAATHVKNNIYRGGVLYLGNGTMRHYKHFEHPNFVTFSVLDKETYPTGLSTTYEIERLSEKEYGLKALNLKTKNDGDLSGITLTRKLWDSNPITRILNLKTSDHQKVDYYLRNLKPGSDSSKRWYLDQVKWDDGRFVNYKYCSREAYGHERITRKELPDGRYLFNVYYQKKKNEVKGNTIQVESNTPMLGRVKLQMAPAGVDEKPITIYTFLYSFGDRMEGNRVVAGAGTTKVYDAYDNITEYSYCMHQRLTSIKKYSGTKLFSKEEFLWGDHDTTDHTNLMFRALYSSDTRAEVARTFKYDEAGNVLEETLWGNLTGNSSDKLTIQKNTPKGEKYTKYYTYTRNCIESIDDGRKIVFHTYDNKTRLVNSTLTKDKSKIITREFFKYDDNGCLVEKIKDNGTSSDPKDLTGVTKKYITRMVNTSQAPYGLPEIVEELYFDFNLNHEVSLGKVVNTYSVRGKLIRQDKYDAEGIYLFSCEWDYDSVGRVIREQNALGHQILRSYDLNGNLISEQGPHENFHKTYSYDFMNRLIKKDEYHSDGTYLSESYRYDYLGNKVASVDPYGNETLYIYDAQSRPIQTIYPEVIDNGKLIKPEEKVDYDLLGRAVKNTDARGGVTRTHYTHHTKPYYKLYADKTSETFEYDLAGVLKKSVNINGSYILYDYDALDRQISKRIYSKEGKLLQTESATYDAFHKLSETDSNGNTIYYQYDGAGRCIKIVKDNAVTTYRYDALGREAEIRDYIDEGRWIATMREYDYLGRVLEERQEDQFGQVLNKKSFEFSTFDQPTKTILYTESGNSVTEVEYNSRGEVIATTDALGNRTHIEYRYDFYNEYGQCVPCIETTDPLGLTTVEIQDALGRKVCEYRKNTMGEVLQKFEYAYDLNGNLTRQEGEGVHKVVNEWTYDVANRVTVTFEAVGTADQKTTKVLYNTYGQKAEVVKADGVVIKYLYDPLGRLAEFFSSDDTVHYVYQYDSLGNPIHVDDLVHNTSTIKSFDSSNRVTSETLGNHLKITYEYDALGRPIRSELPDGSAVEYQYESLYLSKVVRLDKDGSARYDHKYLEFDLMGNVLKSELVGEAGFLEQKVDLLGRVVGIDHSQWQSKVEAYDAVGNMLSKEQKDTNGEVVSRYSYDGLYQLISEDGLQEHLYEYDAMYNRVRKDGRDYKTNALNQVLSDGERGYGYDLNGNMVKKGEGVEYKYDALDRLIGIIESNREVKFEYDEQNRRLTRFEDGKSRRYLYQGMNEVGCVDELGRMEEYRILGIGKGAEMGASVSIELRGEVYVPLHDLHYSVVCLLRMDGEVEEAYRYSAYGEEEVLGGKEAKNPWRYSSKRVEDGLVYFGRRYYDPGLGRWMTADPLGYDAGPNLYAYVMNGPLVHIDLYGLYEEPTKWAELTAREAAFDRAEKSLEKENLKKLEEKERTRSRQEPVVKFSQTLLDSPMNRTDPQVYSVGTWSSRKIGFGYANGVGNTAFDAQNSGSMISEMLGGMVVDVVHNPTEGLQFDVPRAALSLHGPYASKSVEKLIENWNHYFENSDWDSFYVQTCHSEGAINVRNALMCYDVELRQRIFVVAVAPAAYIRKGLCGKVVHLRSTRDFVPLFDISGLQQCKDTTKVIDSHRKASLFDHSINSPTYELPLRKTIPEIYKR